ncbi:hypothetical protein AXW96_12870 [Pseudomonas aeruginosa]|nr:hypothetical protein AXW96_12870 [Pseudomonas aeruginosa]
MQDHTVMADGPAVVGIGEMHRGQQNIDRHLCLLDLAGGRAQQHVAAAPHRHQIIADQLPIGEGRLAG